MKRKQLSEDSFKEVLTIIKLALFNRLKEKGYGAASSSHEILGIVTEEYLELVEAVRKNDRRNMEQELIDIVVGCILGLNSYYEDTLDW